MYSMSILAARIGTVALATHQIVMSLWMVTSYICDGIADVGMYVHHRVIIWAIRVIIRMNIGLSGLSGLSGLLRHDRQCPYTYNSPDNPG